MDTIESCWQLSEGPAECDPATRRAVTRHTQGNLLMQFPLVLEGTRMSLHEGERDPMRGWLPIEWGRTCVPAPLLRLAAPAFDAWNGDMATVLIPFAGATPPSLATQATGPDALQDARVAGRLCLEWADGTRDLVVWTRRLAHAIGRQHGLSTDAALVHLRLDASGALESGLMADGSYGEYDGTDLTGRLQRMDRSSLI